MRVCIRAVSILFALAFYLPAMAASDPAAEAVLKSKGLTKVGLLRIRDYGTHDARFISFLSAREINCDRLRC